MKAESKALQLDRIWAHPPARTLSGHVMLYEVE